MTMAVRVAAACSRSIASRALIGRLAGGANAPPTASIGCGVGSSGSLSHDTYATDPYPAYPPSAATTTRRSLATASNSSNNNSATVASIETSFPDALPNSSLISTLIRSKLAPHGYTSTNTLVATSFCADEVNRTLEAALSKEFGIPNFSMGGLAGFPFGGITAFGAMASHIPDGGSTLVVFGPHVGVSTSGQVGTVERRGRADGGACCGSAIAASGFVAGRLLNASAKYGPSLAKIAKLNVDGSRFDTMFASVDSDGDGLIDRMELVMLFNKMEINLTTKEFDAVYAELDTSGDGNISLSEFTAWWKDSRDRAENGTGTANVGTGGNGGHPRLNLDATDAQQQFVGAMLLPHAERLDKAEEKMVELPYALFDAQKSLMETIVTAGAPNVAGNGTVAVLGGIQINTPVDGEGQMEDYFLPMSFDLYDNKGGLVENLLDN